MISFPNCKINIGLHVINKREDGFHTIETIFYPVPLFDMLEIVEIKNSKGTIDIKVEGLEIEGDQQNNIVVKAYDLLNKDFELGSIKCVLYKNIPIGGGLGGGSSDAAHALKMLNSIFNLKLSNEELKKYASKLGSDCAFFIDNIPSLATGKGELLKPIELSLKNYFLLIVKPTLYINTQRAYSNVNVRNSAGISIAECIQQPISNWKNNIVNDFEQTVFKEFSEIKSIKQKLYDEGAIYASMSGSGSSVFGIFKEYPNKKGLTENYQTFVCKL